MDLLQDLREEGSLLAHWLIRWGTDRSQLGQPELGVHSAVLFRQECQQRPSPRSGGLL